MSSESDAICERIINEIDAVIQKDADLCHFEIVQNTSPQNKNKSPVLHLENNLGLETWCVQHVYEYAHRKILTNKLENAKLINSNNGFIKYLNAAILINSDVGTFWNIRRQLFEKNRLNITKEFQFSSIVLSKKPKSNEALFYRRWLFSFQSGESIDWTFELGLCERCADKSASNYHAWTHRQWVLQKASYLLKYELRITEKFIRKHIADYSAYNHRQFVLSKLFEIGHREENIDYTDLIDFVNNQLSENIQSTDDLLNFILIDKQNMDSNLIKTILFCLNCAAYDLKFCDELKEMFGYREAFDYHRRAILKFIVSVCSTAATDNFNHQPLCKISKVDKESMVSRLLDSLRVSEGQLGETHRKWCQIFLGFDYSDISSSNDSPS